MSVIVNQLASDIEERLGPVTHLIRAEDIPD
ncbi:hypothetical protein BH18ACT8_BH18ACT8_03940 [soil metagenome]